MILGQRQAKIGCALHSEIERAIVIDIEGYESIKKIFIEAFMKKMCHEYTTATKADLKEFTYIQKLIDRDRKLYEDCIEQTITYLKKNKLLKQCEEIKSIELWKDIVEMSPYYEAVNVQLKSMLIKYHCPHMYAEMNKGHVYSHQILTNIGEAVLYIMEYFYKEELLEGENERD